MDKKFLTFCLAALFAPFGAHAATSQCASVYAEGRPPSITDPNVARGVTPICYQGFGILYSPVVMGPLTASDHLTRESVEFRSDRHVAETFHTDENLPQEWQDTVSDFMVKPIALVPADDQVTPDLGEETLTLANAVRVDGYTDATKHGVDSALREIARRYGEVYVVRGPMFLASEKTDDRVKAPTQIFEAYYVPGTKIAGVYVIGAGPNHGCARISLDRLHSLTGIDVFPHLRRSLKSLATPLPETTASSVENRHLVSANEVLPETRVVAQSAKPFRHGPWP